MAAENNGQEALETPHSGKKKLAMSRKAYLLWMSPLLLALAYLVLIILSLIPVMLEDPTVFAWIAVSFAFASGFIFLFLLMPLIPPYLLTIAAARLNGSGRKGTKIALVAALPYIVSILFTVLGYVYIAVSGFDYLEEDIYSAASNLVGVSLITSLMLSITVLFLKDKE